MFCAVDESIDHLFFSCPFARFEWGILQCAFNSHVQRIKRCEVNGWLEKIGGFDRVIAKHVMAAILWSIWKTRNRACFDGVMPSDPF
jgi:hypothetical protein